MKAINLCIAGLLSLLFMVSCDDDNDEISAPIDGIWSGNKAEFRLNPDGIIPPFTVNEDNFPVRLEFKSDHVLVLTDQNNQPVIGTYVLSGRKVTVDIDYEFEYIPMSGTYNIEELTTTRLRASIEKEGTYDHPDTGQRFDGKVKATLYFDRQTDQ
jgi:hypothetical protein